MHINVHFVIFLTVHVYYIYSLICMIHFEIKIKRRQIPSRQTHKNQTVNNVKEKFKEKFYPLFKHTWKFIKIWYFIIYIYFDIYL